MRFRPFPRGWRVLRAGLAVWGAVMAVVTFTPVLSWWTGLLRGPLNDPVGDVLIVLAGDRIDPGMIGETSYWRSVYAVWAWRGGGFREIVLSGEEARSAPMRDFMVSQGVPAPAIRLEPRSTSTLENARFTAELLRGSPGSKVLLTSDFHMYRARRVFEKAGLAVLPRPFPDAGKRLNRWTARWAVFCALAEETAKTGYYLVRGWI